MTSTEIIDRYCQVWAETDVEARENLLSTVWAENATYIDPFVLELNANQLVTHIGTVQVNRPGIKVLRATPVDEHHNFARFGFQVIGSDGTLLREGLDVVFFSADGQKIERIVGFFGSL